MTEVNKFADVKELERKQWLADLGILFIYSKTCVKWPLSKRMKFCFQDQLLVNAGHKYCRMLQGEHSAILTTFIKLPLRHLFCLFLSGPFTQVILYYIYSNGYSSSIVRSTVAHL